MLPSWDEFDSAASQSCIYGCRGWLCRLELGDDDDKLSFEQLDRALMNFARAAGVDVVDQEIQVVLLLLTLLYCAGAAPSGLLLGRCKALTCM